MAVLRLHRRADLWQKVPAFDFRLKRLVVKARIDEARPWRHPWFHHDDDASGPKAACGLPKEGRDIGDVVEDIGHHDAAKLAGSEGEIPPICHQLYSWTLKDLRRNYVGQKSFEEARARAELEHRAVSLRKPGADRSIPVLVDGLEKGLGGDNGATKVSSEGIID